MRSIVAYDILFRLLQYSHGKVVYVRNITDADDKIVTEALEQNISYREVVDNLMPSYLDDQNALNVLQPTHEVKITDSMPAIITMIEQLLANKSAYTSEQHVLFDVTTIKDFGVLSGRTLDTLKPGSRIEVESYKRHPGDFVLWKPATEIDIKTCCVFDSPWGKGRPGWHIECSAVATQYLGKDFDIHGGGADLMFPHHENEIAQCKGCEPHSHFAKFWVHNGFVTVNGSKMSKSLGNVITVQDLLKRGYNGEVIRYALLKTKYCEPLNWTDKLIEDAQKELDSLYRKIKSDPHTKLDLSFASEFMKVLQDDMNVPKALSLLHSQQTGTVKYLGKILGILQQDPEVWFKPVFDPTELVALRKAAKDSKDWAETDRIRLELQEKGVILQDLKDGTTTWYKA